MTRARDLANLIGSGNYTSTTFTATAGQTVFTIAHTPNFIQVFMNGLLLDETTDYTSNGTAVTLTSAATAGDELEVVKYNTFSVGDAITQTAADSRYVNATGDTMTGGLNVLANVGIGTSSTSGLLHLTKGSRDLQFLLETAPASGDVGVQLRAGSGDYVGIASGTGTGIVVDSSNNVGIGTSSPDLVGSTTTLTINNSGGNGQLSLMGNGTVYGRIFADNATGDLKMGNPTSNDVMFYTANTERMRIDSAGRVTMPYQPSWSLSRGTNQYYATTGGAVIPFYNTGDYVGRHVTGVTSNGSGRITVPVSGRYQINATIYFTRSSGTNDGYAYIMINGAADLWSGSAYAGTGTYYDTITFSQMINLSTNDYLEIYAGGPIYSIYGASTFSGYLVG